MTWYVVNVAMLVIGAIEVGGILAILAKMSGS